MTEHFQPRSKKGRGMSKDSIDLIKAMYVEAEKAQPITGRGIGYKLFARGLIPSMAEMPSVYRLLRIAREKDIIPWDWIVDETRSLEQVASWDNPKQYAETMMRAYRKDYWNQQPCRVEVWSEKGTVRGVLAPILHKYGVGFRVAHGFSSATMAHDVSQDDDGRPLILLYVGDYDPSGMNMSEHDLPTRFEKYDGDHIELKRVALRKEQLANLQSFPASDKQRDTRYKWFVERYGQRCWELDAMDPRDLRKLVEKAIKKHIEPVAWKRCQVTEKAEKESIRVGIRRWNNKKPQPPRVRRPRKNQGLSWIKEYLDYGPPPPQQEDEGFSIFNLGQK
jgi:hypothetical protein